MRAYHVTTPKKLERYKATGCILPPVRFWSTRHSAERWAKRTGRSVIVEFEAPPETHPLPIKGGAYWSPRMVWANDFYTRSPSDDKRQDLRGMRTRIQLQLWTRGPLVLLARVYLPRRSRGHAGADSVNGCSLGRA